MKTKVSVAQSCPTLCGPMDHGPPGSFIRKILQARILEWVAGPKFSQNRHTLMLGKTEGKRRRRRQRMRWLHDITDLMDMRLSKLLE